MKTCIKLLVIISVLCAGKDAKIISSNLDLNSNMVPMNLDLQEAHNNFEGDSGVKKDLYVGKYKDALKMEVKSYFDNESAKIPVDIIKENNGIDQELQVGDINDNSNLDVVNNEDLNVTDEELQITNIVLAKIRELLENELQNRREEYKVYVPISEDLVNPDYIPQGLRASANPVKKDGLPLIDLKGQPQT